MENPTDRSPETMRGSMAPRAARNNGALRRNEGQSAGARGRVDREMATSGGAGNKAAAEQHGV